MAAVPPGLYVRISNDIWESETLANVSKPARWLYIALIAWSKAKECNGGFTRYAVTRCDGSEEDLQELLREKLVVPSDNEYLIPTWAAWQMTTEDIKEQKIKKKAAARVRWDRKLAEDAAKLAEEAASGGSAA